MVLGGVVAAGCASAPKTTAQKQTLEQDANQTVAEMTSRDPDLKPMLDRSTAYIVFPSVKQGGFVVGGAGGKGVLLQHGRMTGFVDLSQASLGAQVGGQEFAEIIVVRDQAALDKIKAGKFDMGGQASATMVKAGAAAAAPFSDQGLAVFVNPKGGAMLNVSVTGQTLKYVM
jgi:lipid-binding SYLF domain-containing protein